MSGLFVRASRRLAWVLAGAALACAQGRTYLESVDIPGDRPASEKVEVARRMATLEAYERLLARARARFPSVDEHQLKQLVLSWRVYHAGDAAQSERVALVVGFRNADSSFDPRPLIDYCKEVLLEELREPPASGG
jgi:hypothetical protein